MPRKILQNFFSHFTNFRVGEENLRWLDMRQSCLKRNQSTTCNTGERLNTSSSLLMKPSSNSSQTTSPVLGVIATILIETRSSAPIPPSRPSTMQTNTGGVIKYGSSKLSTSSMNLHMSEMIYQQTQLSRILRRSRVHCNQFTFKRIISVVRDLLQSRSFCLTYDAHLEGRRFYI